MTSRKGKARTSPKPRASSKENTQETESAPERGELIVPREAKPSRAPRRRIVIKAPTCDVEYEYADLVERGRAAVAAMAGHMWELGDLARQVETRYGEGRLQQFADDVGVPFKTVQSART